MLVPQQVKSLTGFQLFGVVVRFTTASLFALICCDVTFGLSGVPFLCSYRFAAHDTYL